MRLGDFVDYFRLRPHLVHPWAFLKLRKYPPKEPFIDIALKTGWNCRLRPDAHD